MRVLVRRKQRGNDGLAAREGREGEEMLRGQSKYFGVRGSRGPCGYTEEEGEVYGKQFGGVSVCICRIETLCNVGSRGEMKEWREGRLWIEILDA